MRKILSGLQEAISNNKLMVVLILFLFLFRLVYGLFAEFWFEDELQIYLIGLKSYTTGTWPFFGPDVVYTETQIPGALQALLISVPLKILAIPESPTLFLNILSFISLLYFAYYIHKRIPTIPFWLSTSWIMFLSWSMDYGTRVVNPSYVLVFSIPFFIALFELLPIYSAPLFSKKIAYLLLGICPGFIMQLHMSYVLLLPLIGIVLFLDFRSTSDTSSRKIHYLLLLFGILIGISTLLPTYLFAGNWKSTSSNIVFNVANFKNILTILLRYLSFASFEVPYILGGSTVQRLAVIRYSIWVVPFVLYLLVFGFLLVGSFIYVYFKNKAQGPWLIIKRLALFMYILIFLSFFFSIKGPSSHTFFLVFPVIVFYSFYCHAYLLEKFTLWKKLMYGALFSCIFFYAAIANYNFTYKSMYKNRSQVEKAITHKDYKILGTRRSEAWKNGY